MFEFPAPFAQGDLSEWKSTGEASRQCLWVNRLIISATKFFWGKGQIETYQSRSRHKQTQHASMGTVRGPRNGLWNKCSQ